MIEGSECRCGFKTISTRVSCPRCKKPMNRASFPDEGKVLSYTRLQVPPEGFNAPLDIVMVEIDTGPKLVCWTDSSLEVDQRVRVFSDQGMLRCIPL